MAVDTDLLAPTRSYITGSSTASTFSVLDELPTDDGGARLLLGTAYVIHPVLSLRPLTATPGTSPGLVFIEPSSDVGERGLSWYGPAVPGRRVRPSQPHVEIIREIKKATELSDERVAALLGVKRQTLANWLRGRRISDRKQRRLYAVNRILLLAGLRHPSPAELVQWLDTPRGANGRTPARLLEDGQLDEARYLVVASPSPSVKPPPAWARRPIPPVFQQGAETRDEALPPEEADSDAPNGVHD